MAIIYDIAIAANAVRPLAIWNLILAFGAALNVERFGRRPLFLISIIGMLLSYVVVMGLSAGFANSKSQALGTAVIPCLFMLVVLSIPS